MRRSSLSCGFLLLATIAPAQEKPEKVQVQVVKYAELGQLVQQQRGKVVVMDLWATW